ncbi:MAG: hypothetical protein B6242_07285 [Anaerolineaceae bacterium 4572_78]|nr:MAG: hypothetical protein B6242_07285 [Anaerolineaceae bacterium 4572_78]
MNNLHTRYLKRIILFAIFIIAFIPINLHAQEPELRFDNINIRDGLSQSSVYAILQDRQGFMWFGTQDGLNKYDGYDFTVFKRDPDDSNSLSGNWITSIYEDTAGIIWIGTYKNGLNRFDPKTNTFHHYYYDEKDPNSFHGNTVSYIYQDKAGTLWVSTDMGLNKVGVYGHKPLLSQNDPTKITFAFFKSDEEKQTIKDVLEDGNGRLWVATSTGLKEFDRETETFIVHDYIPDSDSQEESLISIPETDRIITSIAEDPQGYLWLGTDIGLLKFYPETGLFTFYEKDDKPGSLSDNGIKTVYIDSKWHLWIGTSMGGLNRFNRETETFSHYTSSVNNPTSLSNSEINVIYEDRGGILWVGTSLDGINKFNSMTEEFHHYLDELSHKSMWAFHEDNEGMLWIGTSFGLNKFDRQAKTITHYIHDPEDKTSLAGNFVQAIYEDSGHNLWVGASGLNKFDRETETFTSYQHDPDDPNSIADYKVSTIHEDETGNLWIGTGNSLEKFDIDSETFSHYRSDFPIFERLYMSVIEIDQDKSGMIWFAGAGLTKFDPDTEKFQHYFHEPDNPNSLSENSTSSIYADENGMIWVSTYGGGFNKFDPQTEKFTAYREKHGLPNDFVYGILGDKEGNLWMSTNNGISKFNPETETFRNYTDKNGLQSNEFNGGAFYQSPSGEMFFGGVNGFNAFYPEKIKDNPHAPQVVITRFKKMNEEGGLVYEDTNFLTYLDLPYYSYLFTIYFAGLDYADPLENQYMYKLEGFDNDWVESNANERFALYSNLAGGDYVFRAKAANNDGTWSEEGLTIDVHITPPPWKTWWAYTIYVLIVAGLIFSYIRYRTTQQKLEIERKEKELEQERIVSERLRQLDRIKDEFLANTSHELRTPINGIVGLAESLIDGATGMLPEQTVYNLSMIVSSGWRLTNLVNDLLDFSKLKHKTLELNTKPVDMRSLTDVVLMLCRSLVGTKDIEIHNNISHDVVRSQGLGVRSQGLGVRSQGLGVRGQNP